MRKINTTYRVGILGVMIAVVASYLFFQPLAHADVPSVIINEIMYNPASGVDGDEFVELYNTTANDIDLTGWCFTAGITLCFTPGTTLTAHGYGLVSPGSARTLATYNKTTLGTYTGKLDNGGERVTLSDSVPQIVNTVLYDDVSPWPTSPDGTGPSLELKDPTFDNATASSWAASIGNPTPGDENSVFSAALPNITAVSTPQDVAPSATPLITAHITDASSVNLAYKVMYNNEQQIAMNDAGVNGDVTASDNTYSATLPAQSAGELVRYKISASNGNGSITSPGGGDTINYFGYTITDSSFSTQLPILQFFMEPAQMADMIANHWADDQEFPCVIAYGNTVIDNSTVHIKGQTTRGLPKKAFAVDLPQGHKLLFASMTRAVDEFHLNSTYLDASGVADIMAWRVAEQIGMPTTQMFKIRLQNNGDFYGLYTFAEEYDKNWREEYGFQDGSFYKGTVKKTRTSIDDGYELQEWNQGVSNNSANSRVSYAVNNQDIPNTLNLMAFDTFLRNWDVTFGKNWLAYHDITGTGRWKSLPYDLDATFFGGSAWVAGQQFITPYEMPGTYGNFTREYRAPLLALYDDPLYRQSYFRRLRTLTDDYLMSGWLNNQFDELTSMTEPEFILDYQKWGSLSDPTYARKNVQDVLAEMKLNLTKRFRKPWGVPASQVSNPSVEINNVNINISNRTEDYVVLKNNTVSAIDMSHWKINELNYTLPVGAVIAPGQSGVITRKDTVFTAAHPGVYVIGELQEDIPITGNLTLERNNNTTSDTWLII